MRSPYQVDPHKRDFAMIIHEVRTNRTFSRDHCDRLERLIQDLPLHEDLSNLCARLMTLFKAKPIRPVCSSLLEIAAGLDYAKFEKVGTLANLKSVLQPTTAHYARTFVEEMTTCMRNKDYLSNDCWFRLRAKVMDLFTTCLISLCDTPIIVFYGGGAHTESVAAALRNHGNYDTVKPLHSRRIFDIEVLRPRDKTQKVVFLGENHSKTPLQCVDKLTTWLNKRCNGPTCTFMIERHRPLMEDSQSIPNTIACEATERFAIQKARCAPLMTRACGNIKIEFVDNRHSDLGFFRKEVGDACAIDATYQSLFTTFQKNALAGTIEQVERELANQK